MWTEIYDKHSFTVDGQDYEIRWKISRENHSRLEVYEMPQNTFILAIESKLPYAREFIEKDSYRRNRAEKIEKVFRGENLTLDDIML